jgi:DNA-binding NtrC family response regulator
MNEKVLVVDDEESILKGINLNLGRSFDITTANSPEEALQKVNEIGPFAVIVSDMRMPGMDGATMMRQIKEKQPETICILLTGHADFEFGGSQALQSGQLFKILNKPCPPNTLKATIQNALAFRNQEKPQEEKPPDFVL